MSFVNSKLAALWGLGKQDYGGSSERQSLPLVLEILFLSMTLAEFRALSEEDQTAAVYAAGTLVGQRWQQVDEAVLLYRMPGDFFAELTYNTAHRQVLYPDSFGDDEPDKLEDYALFVRLPGWLPETEE